MGLDSASSAAHSRPAADRAATVELRRAGQHARAQADLLTTVMNSISEGVIVVDNDGNLLHYNPAAASIVEVDGAAVDLNHWAEQFPIYRPDGVTAFPATELPLIRALQHGETSERVEMTFGNAGPLTGAILSVSSRPLHDRAGRRGAVAVFRDISSRIQHHAELAAAAESLHAELDRRCQIEAELLEQQHELQAFAGIVAHDLKAPLTAISGYTELLHDDLQHQPPRITSNTITSLERVVGGVQRMRHLIDDLLQYATARDGELHNQPVDLQTVVEQVITERTGHLRTGRDQHGRPTLFPDIYTGPLPTVLADPPMMRQLLDNLIGNALKYTQPGQPARLDIAAHPQPDGSVRIDIADRGIGIPDGQHEKIFTNFHRAHTDGTYHGTGLGLAICHRIVQRHGGTINVTDNPGGGSRFHLTLPTAHNNINPPTRTRDEQRRRTGHCAVPR